MRIQGRSTWSIGTVVRRHCKSLPLPRPLVPAGAMTLWGLSWELLCQCCRLVSTFLHILGPCCTRSCRSWHASCPCLGCGSCGWPFPYSFPSVFHGPRL